MLGTGRPQAAPGSGGLKPSSPGRARAHRRAPGPSCHHRFSRTTGSRACPENQHLQGTVCIRRGRLTGWWRLRSPRMRRLRGGWPGELAVGFQFKPEAPRPGGLMAKSQPGPKALRTRSPRAPEQGPTTSQLTGREDRPSSTSCSLRPPAGYRGPQPRGGRPASLSPLPHLGASPGPSSQTGPELAVTRMPGLRAHKPPQT